MDIILAKSGRHKNTVSCLKIIAASFIFQISVSFYDKQRLERGLIAPKFDLSILAVNLIDTEIITLKQSSDPSMLQTYFVVIEHLRRYDRRQNRMPFCIMG